MIRTSWCGQVAAPKAMARSAFSRRPGARPSAAPMTNTTGRRVLRPPALQAAGEGRAAHALAALVQDHRDRALRDDVGDGDRFFEHATGGIAGAALLDLHDIEGCSSPRRGRHRPRACDSAPPVRVRDLVLIGRRRPTRYACATIRMERAAAQAAHERALTDRQSVSARPASTRPGRRPHLLQIVEGAGFRPEHMDDHVAGVDQHPVAVRHALDPDLAEPALARSSSRRAATAPT
jgi:hypothetical protein